MNYIESKILSRLRLIGFLFVITFVSASIPSITKAQAIATVSPEVRTSQALTNDDKAKLFEKIWKLIDKRYYDPKMNGVNWSLQKETYQPLIEKTKTDAEFYDVIKKMVGEMNDAHTRFLTPREAREDRAKKGTSVGLLISKVEGKPVIEKVTPNATDDLAKVKPGMIVRSIDGVAFDKKLAEAFDNVGGSSSSRASEIISYRRVLSGKPETKVRIGLTDIDGKDFEVTLVRKIIDRKSKVFTKKLDSGIGYINVTSFKAPISGKFREALIELKDAPALIIDLRYNGGGSIGEVLRMAGFLINEKRSFGKIIRRKGKTKQSLRNFSAGKKGGQLYSKPVYVLTSKFSASGSELFSSSLQEFGRAKVIGTQTCGCLLGISRKHRLRGGGELHISDIGFLSSKGRVYEKAGVTPDKVIQLKIADLVNGVDVGIIEAEKMQNDSNANF